MAERYLRDPFPSVAVRAYNSALSNIGKESPWSKSVSTARRPGTVVASKILADALAKEGNWVQAYPEFGVERRGSPVVAFIRIDDRQIYDKSRIYAPDHVVVVDPTLVDAIDVTEG